MVFPLGIGFKRKKMKNKFNIKVLTLLVILGCFVDFNANAQVWVRADLNFGAARTRSANSFSTEGGAGYAIRLYYHLNPHFSVGMLYGKREYHIGQLFVVDLIDYSLTPILARGRWDVFPTQKLNIYTEFGVGAVVKKVEQSKATVDLALSPTLGARLMMGERVSFFMEFDWMMIMDSEWVEIRDEINQDVFYQKKMNSRTFSFNLGLGVKIFKQKK